MGYDGQKSAYLYRINKRQLLKIMEKYYIDYCMKDQDTMLQIALYYMVGENGDHKYSFDFSDSKEKKLNKWECSII